MKTAVKVNLKEIEPYVKEWKRQHISKLGYRTFYHPCLKDLTIIVKGNEVVGMAWTAKIMHNNSETRWIFANKEFIEFEF